MEIIYYLYLPSGLVLIIFTTKKARSIVMIDTKELKQVESISSDSNSPSLSYIINDVAQKLSSSIQILGEAISPSHNVVVEISSESFRAH